MLLCLFCCVVSLAQSPGAKILVLEKEEGEKRVRRPREAGPIPISEFILKISPQNSGSQRLVLGTEAIPPGGRIAKHRHLGQDEILFLQTGSARVTLNEKDYDIHAGATVFFLMNTWVSLQTPAANRSSSSLSSPLLDSRITCAVPLFQLASPLRRLLSTTHANAPTADMWSTRCCLVRPSRSCCHLWGSVAGYMWRTGFQIN